MSKLTNATYAGAGIVGTYHGVNQIGEMGSETARDIHTVMKVIKDTVVDTSIEILNTTSTYVGSDAPLSYFGIQQFAGKISDIFENTDIVLGAVAAGAGYIGAKVGNWGNKKISNALGVSTTKGDERIAQATFGLTGAGLLLQIPEVLNAGALGGSYLLSRKLGEKVLGERYSQLVGGSGAMALTSVMHNGSFINNPDLFSIASLGLGSAALIGKVIKG
ncbi:hypothetical protein LAT59_05070 [Candidatus Gracilibacteria bacterium]|nr:hypothetical protein [Candidatus Gracilibacteria bacterium]